MTNNDLNKKYSLGTRIIHWFTAALVLIVFPLGKYIDGLLPADKMGLLRFHSMLGIIVLVLTLIRVYFYFKHDRPERVKTGSKWNDKLIILVHNGFYFVLAGLGLSGMVVLVSGGYWEALTQGVPELMKSHKDIPALEIHELFASLVMIMLVLHVAGVVKHLVLRKENMFKRIF